MAMQLSSSSSSFSYAFTYQVFLSFRGTDTRHGFTGNLYKALKDKGIHTFIDDNDLQRGDEITPSLLKAIEESRIFIPVFSINYPSSSFCLDELVHIIHCYKTKGRSVLPVFYGVDPTHIRHQTGSFGEHLTKHEEKFQNNKENMERLKQWKMALTKAANLSGYHSSQGYEYKFIGDIVEDISNRISRKPLHVAKYPVGLQSRVQQVKSLLDEGSDDRICMVGLHGTGGLGKSTLAKEIYNSIADQFEGVCFLHNVRENSAHNNLKDLQEELLFKTVTLNIKLGDVSEGIPIIKERLCRKKILLILDDVDKLDQLEALAGGLDWFGPGSRVIITTRDKQLLSKHEVQRNYEVDGLNEYEALELLRLMAFKDKKIDSSYDNILNHAIKYASGLPLALEVVGSNLFGKSIAECESILDKYGRIPHKDIQKILRVSYDALEEEEQSVFLDIACCFKRRVLAEVEEILQCHYGHCIKCHIGVLVGKSLLKISNQHHWDSHVSVTLHDLLEHMGKEIVRQESIKEPGERSRLWHPHDIVDVLQENTGTSKLEMVYMNFPPMEFVVDWNEEAFKKTTKLKTIIIENWIFSEGPKSLPRSLTLVKWKGCTLESLSSSILNEKEFKKMKILTLDHSQYLTHIPNMSGLPNLQKFSFEKCHNLITIDNSTGELNKLEILSAKYCGKLESFPPLQLPSLKELKLSFCKSLKSFPELLCKMENLKDIQLYQTSIGELPSSFHNLSELCDLTIHRSGGVMFRFPKHNDEMYSIVFSKLKKLKLSINSLSDECLQITLKWCVIVEELDLSGSNFKTLPECLNEFHLMRTLKLDYCMYLEDIRGIPPNLDYLSAMGCESLSSSSRGKLLSQKVHEAGCTLFRFPTGTEGIPDWFEHQIRGDTISFWFRKNIPSITSILISLVSQRIPVIFLIVNGSTNLRNYLSFGSLDNTSNIDQKSEHAYLFDLKLEEHIKGCKSVEGNLMSEVDHALLKNEWIHVELNFVDSVWNPREDEKIEILNSLQMGIHVWKEKSNMEEDVIFTNPHRETKSDENKTFEKDVILSSWGDFSAQSGIIRDMQSPSSFTDQVFLSFRGPDTRHGFTGSLYKALINKGIHALIDDNDLRSGYEISPSLLMAIEESRIFIFIPIFSANYASSSFCLDELVHIIHCYKTKGCLILPVFVGVDPTHIRHQTGSCGEHLTKHEEKFQNNKKNMDRLKQWKMALTQAASLSGYHSSQGYEYKLIENIAKDISDRINRVILHVAKYPVGLQFRVQQVRSLLAEGSGDVVSMVGLYGTGGMGKSTLAKEIYNSVAVQFEAVCFLHQVRQNSTHNNLEKLQKELLSKTVKFEDTIVDVSEGISIIKERLSSKKILLILDDVDNPKQLEALAGGLDWFGPGSRVIITTRDKHLLDCHGIETTYAVKELYRIEALVLLRWMAFKNDEVPSGYEEIFNRALIYASGLPLAIVIIGANLFGRSVENWKHTFDEYEKIPNEKIQNILKVSYDALEEKEKSVFLDIACCFKGCKWTEISEILDARYGHSIKYHVDVLAEKNLIEFNGDVTLHDLIEEMGKEIVRQESPKEPGERSRLWWHDDILHVLRENTGTGNIEIIDLNCPSMENIIDWNGEAFKKMSNLKILIIENGGFSEGLEYLPSSLVFCKWIGCPSKSLSFLSNKNFGNMKSLILDWSEFLTHIPNVSGLENLIKFSFENCRKLIKIENSIWKLNKLEHLSAKGCLKLESFPPLHLPSLKELELSECDSLKSFPELLCHMTNIKKINFCNTSIGELPFSFQYLSELSGLHVNRVRMLRFPNHDDKMNPIVFSKMDTVILGETNLSDECLPILLKWFVNVTSLKLMKNNFKILPKCLSECHHLEELVLDDCKFLEEIRGFPPNLRKFNAVGCVSLSLESRRKLLSQQLHEAGCTKISFPNGSEGIPDWFEHQSRGDTISFWFGKKIPTITCIFLIPGSVLLPEINLFLNGKKITLTDCLFHYDGVLPLEHAFLCDLNLHSNIYESFANEPYELYEAFKNNEWNHVELKLEKDYLYLSQDAFGNLTYTHLIPNGIEILGSAQMGIQVLWNGYDFSDMEDDFSDTEVEKRNKEGVVRFTDPYSRKRKLDEYLNPYSNTSLSQFVPPLKKLRLVDVGVSKKEILQQQHLAALVSNMRNLVLTETKEKEPHRDILSGMWNLVLTETKEKEHQG